MSDARDVPPSHTFYLLVGTNNLDNNYGEVSYRTVVPVQNFLARLGIRDSIEFDEQEEQENYILTTSAEMWNDDVYAGNGEGEIINARYTH